MKKLKLLLLLSFLGLLLFESCSKKDDDNTPPEVAKLAIQEKLDEIQVPANLANSQSIYALQVNAYVSLIKGIGSYFLFFDPIDDAEYDNGTYFWTYGGQSIWMEYTENSNAYVFNMDVDFGSGRTDYITSEDKKDGSGGWMHIYDISDDVAGDYIYEYTWEIDADGGVKVTYNDKEDNDKLELFGHPDDSGYVKSYIDGILDYEFVWNSDGSGYYNQYNENGETIDGDSWTVDDL